MSPELWRRSTNLMLVLPFTPPRTSTTRERKSSLLSPLPTSLDLSPSRLTRLLEVSRSFHLFRVLLELETDTTSSPSDSEPVSTSQSDRLLTLPEDVVQERDGGLMGEGYRVERVPPTYTVRSLSFLSHRSPFLPSSSADFHLN